MPHKSSTTARLEAFSDGVIAVIITIMVLEFKVPHANGPEGLRAILPTLTVYAISYAFTGIYWLNHHHLVDRIEHIDPLIVYANLLWLFSLSLLPFFTSWVIEKQIDPFSVTLYAVSMILTGFAFFLLRLAIFRRLRHTGELDEDDIATKRKHLASLVMYACSIPLAHVHPYLGLGLISLVTLVWIFPTASEFFKQTRITS